MLNSNAIMMVIAGLHFLLWGLTQFFLGVTGAASECDVTRVFCDTPVEYFVQSSSQPDLGLLGVIRLVPNLVTSVWSLLSFNYGLLEGDGITGIVSAVLRLVGAVLGVTMAWAAVSSLLNAYRN